MRYFVLPIFDGVIMKGRHILCSCYTRGHPPLKTLDAHFIIMTPLKMSKLKILF